MVKRLKDAQCHCTVVIREMQNKTMRYYFIAPYCLEKYSLTVSNVGQDPE